MMKKRLFHLLESAGCAALCIRLILSVHRLSEHRPMTRELALGEVRSLLPWLLLLIVWTALTLHFRQKEKPPALCCVPLSEDSAKSRTVRCLFGALSFALTVPAAVFLCDAEHFSGTDPKALEAMLQGILTGAGPWLAGALASQCLSAFLSQRLLRLSGAPGRRRPAPAARFDRLLPWARGGLMLLSLLLILHGVLNGSMWDVLVKAIHICTECIGLG